MSGAAHAWLDSDWGSLHAQVRRLKELRPAAPAARFYAAAAAWRADPEAPVQQSLDPGWEDLFQGIRSSRARDPEQLRAAVKRFQTAARLLADSPLPPAELARAARRAGDLSQAVRALSAAVGLFPTSGRLHWELARALYESGDTEAALPAARRATELEPGVARYWVQLARTCYRAKRFAEGLRAARAAAARSGPRNKTALRSVAVLLASNGEHEESKKVLNVLYRLDPKNRNTLFGLGLEHDILDRHELAMRYYRETIALYPRDCEALVCLASIHAGADRSKCERCARFFRDHPEVLDDDRAEALCQQALAIDRGASTATLSAVIDVLQRIDRLEGLLPELERLRDAASDDQRIVHLQRARRALRSAGTAGEGGGHAPGKEQ